MIHTNASYITRQIDINTMKTKPQISTNGVYTHGETKEAETNERRTLSLSTQSTQFGCDDIAVDPIECDYNDNYLNQSVSLSPSPSPSPFQSYTIGDADDEEQDYILLPHTYESQNFADASIFSLDEQSPTFDYDEYPDSDSGAGHFCGFELELDSNLISIESAPCHDNPNTFSPQCAEYEYILDDANEFSNLSLTLNAQIIPKSLTNIFLQHTPIQSPVHLPIEQNKNNHNESYEKKFDWSIHPNDIRISDDVCQHLLKLVDYQTDEDIN